MKALICSDYSIAGKHVLFEAGKFLAAFPDAEIYVFSVIEASIIAVGGMYNNNALVEALEKESEQINVWANDIFKGRKIQFITEVGYPAEIIMQKVAQLSADLLIMGTHGRTGLGRVMIGSVAENVLRHAVCNTLVIPVKKFKISQES